MTIFGSPISSSSLCLRVFRVFSLSVAVVLAASVKPAVAQRFLTDVASHNKAVQSVQPSGWTGPLVTTNVCLTQNYRAEFARQITPAGIQAWNIGNGKGLSLIMSKRVEFDTSFPNYAVHNDPKTRDGLGDFSFTTKYRLFSGTNNHGNYILSASTGQTFSTGQFKNGAASYTRNYTLMGGKGFGRFDVQSTAGVILPASAGLATVGRPVTWNTAFQYHILRRAWVELEDNATFYNGGSHNGKKQNYLTPGVVVSGIRPHSWGESNPRSFVFGTAMQVVTTTYRSTNHNLILMSKMTF